MGAVGIALGIFGLGLIGIAWLRRSARKTRARALRREVELVEVVVPRGAVAVRDDILNRQAGVPQREAAAERNDESGTDVSAREYVGEGAGKGDREGWETLPAYHR